MYNMLNTNNPVVAQMIQNEKEMYIANQVIRLLHSEKLTKSEYERIINIVKERV